MKSLVSGATSFVGGSDPAAPVLPNGVARTQLGPLGSHLLLAGGSYFGISGPTWLHDVATGTYQALTGHVTRGAFSTDGRWLAYHRPATEGGVFHQLYLRELDSAAETLVSYTYGQSTPANDHSRVIGFSRDDRYLLFSSHASDLTPNDGNAAADVFLHDRQTGSNLLVSRSGNGSANGFSGKAALTADGGKIFFESHASDLTAHDHNHERDIFVLTFQQLQDHDNDGLPDEWELAYFNDLDEDGSGDADGDGMSDADEFRAGTIPTIGTSVLRVVTLTSIGSGTTTVLWQAVPGRSYRVEYRNSFPGSGWEPAGGIVTADSSLGSFAHVAPLAGERYYRVMVEE